MRSGGFWSQEDRLTAADAPAFAQFGISVSLEGNRALVGASESFGPGAAYTFLRSGTAWSQEAKLTASDGTVNDYFGISVSLDGDRAFVGATRDDGQRGAAYAFERAGTAWTELSRYVASDRAMFDNLGEAVAVSGEFGIAGAYGDDDLGTQSGSAYIFRLGTTVIVNDARDAPNDLLSMDEEICDVDRDDSGSQCTLRAAIELANAVGGATVHFDIPGAGVPRIEVVNFSAGPDFFDYGLPPFTAPITLDATTQPGGWVELVEPEPGFPFLYGIIVEGGGEGSSVRGLVVHGFEGGGITLHADGCLIAGNRIGTDVTGTEWRGNGLGENGGVRVASSDNRIEDNVIAGNISTSSDGLLIGGVQVVVVNGDRNEITGNRIGVGADGRVVVLPPVDPDASATFYPIGIRLWGNSTLNVVGAGMAVPGACVSPCNVIAGHLVEVEIGGSSGGETVGTTVSGNWIGVDANGTPAYFDSDLGRFDVDKGIIDEGTGSVLSHNRIQAEDEALTVGAEAEAVGNVLEGRAEGYHQRGVNRAMVDVVGPGAAVRDNTIRSYSFRGVVFSGDDNTLVQNEVFDNPLGGIEVQKGTGNVIADNDVHDNGRLGIGVVNFDSEAPTAVLARNAVYGHDIGIDLFPHTGAFVEVPPWGQAFASDGVTLNDADDADDGPNGFLNFPDVLSVSADGDAVTVAGFVEAPLLDTAPYFVEVFTGEGCAAGVAAYLGGQPYGEGAHYLGVGGGNADLGYADFAFTLDGLPEGHTHVALTATRLDLGATSEFGRCLPLVGPEQVAQASVEAGETGVVLDGQGATVTITSALRRSSAARRHGGGTLYLTRYEARPDSSVFADTTATGAGGTDVRPEAVAWRYWLLADRGLTPDGGAAPGAGATFDVCFDPTDVVAPPALEEVVVVRRSEETEGLWVPYATTLTTHGGTPYLCAEGVSALGELGLGGAADAFPVANEPGPGDPAGLPAAFALHAPYPNPSAGTTTLRYDLPETGAVRVAVYDLLGREVAVLVAGEREAGTHAAVLDGRSLAAGVYVARLTAGQHAFTQRITLAR